MNSSGKMKYKWDDLNWRKLAANVLKLQKRIYRASARGDRRRVHQLQKLLTKSQCAKLLAVRRVTQLNPGKKTAGIDGVKSLSPAQRLTLADTLRLDGRCQPVRRIWIPKPWKSGRRPLGLPTMIDRAKQALAKLALEPEWEAKFEPNSYGFRPARSCQDALRAIHMAVSQKAAGAYVLDADISGCFDNIDHRVLLQRLDTFPRLRRVIKGWLRAGIMEGNVFQKSRAGTPQGGVLSPLLANVALHGLEYETKNALKVDLFQHMKRSCGKASAPRSQSKMSIVIYADDFVVLHESKEIIGKAKAFIKDWLAQRGLGLSDAKTRITHTLKSEEDGEIGFTFLGFLVRQYPTLSKKRGFVTLLKPSPESQKRQTKIIKERLRQKLAVTQKEVIEALNPIVRGWSDYYRYSSACRIFRRIDDYMFHRLWKWASVRHPTKGVRWVKRKYFRKYRGNCWRFRTHAGEMLSLHSDTRIKRYVKIKGTHSPFDGNTEYWTKRSKTKNACRKALSDLSSKKCA